jgi:hypothetical protein
LEASDDPARNKADQPGKISPKPLQRVPISLLPGDYVRNRVTVAEQAARLSLNQLEHSSLRI